MPRKLALKRLTASDLTFLEWHFRNRNAGNQKAINLNADVFIAELYPSLPTVALTRGGRVPIDLYIYGPGLHGEYNLQRKIVKFGAYKNWRLNGEFVFNPTDTPARFDQMLPGDFALLEFMGEIVPDSAKLVFISQTDQEDVSLHSAFNQFIAGRSMVALTPSELQTLVRQAAPNAQHPVNELILLDAVLEDAAMGGTWGRERLQRSRRAGRRILLEALQRARREAEATGRLGEEYVYSYFASLQQQNQIAGFEWVSESFVTPYDFWSSIDGVSKNLIEVKSTYGEFDRIIHISISELERMASGPERHDLYRIFQIAETTAQLRIAENAGPLAASILQSLSALPPGVTADGISIAPSTMSFGPPVTIELTGGINEEEPPQNTAT